MPADTLTLILAIEQGIRLDPLTQHRAKAAVPFGGQYRIIDFTLANCLHSGLRRILILTQYKSHSLHKHFRDGWSLFNPGLGEFITPVPPQMRENQDWYAGPCDAIRQNRYLIKRNRANWILVLDGGYIYRMDYAELLQAHQETGAQITIAVRATTKKTLTQTQVIIDENGRIVTLTLAPINSQNSAPKHFETMGVYLFNKDYLLNLLVNHEKEIHPDQDLARDFIAPIVQTSRVFAYQFGGERGRVTPDNYWSDLASIDEYYQANLALLRTTPPLDLYQTNWNIHTYQGQYPPARTVPGPITGNEGLFVNSMLAAGSIVRGGGVSRSILFPRVQVQDNAIVEEAILFEGVQIGAGAHVKKCIIEKDIVIPPGEQIGLDQQKDRERFRVSADGIVVLTKGMKIGGTIG